MSVQPQEKLKLNGEVIASVNKLLVGSRKRMESLPDTISLAKGGDAHELLTKSRKRVTAAMNKFETEAKKQGLRHRAGAIAIVRLFATAYNHLDSAIDALEDGELTKAELVEVATDTRSVLVQAKTLMRADVVDANAVEVDDADKFLAKAEQVVAAPDETAGPKVKTKRQQEDDEIEEEEREKSEKRQATQDKHYQGIGDLFKSTLVHLTTLPSAKTSTDPFILTKMPVFPRTSSIVGEAQYKQAGLKVGGKAGFYIQLNDQVLLGVNTAQLGKVKLEKRVLEIVKILSQKKHTIYHVIGSDGHSTDGAGRMAPGGHSPGFVYYWIMDDRTLSRLNSVLGRGGNGFDVEDWGMAAPTK